MDPRPASAHDRPPRPKPTPDPLAVALGNASLLGVGYLMMRRLWLALGSLAVTIALVLVLALVARSPWAEYALVLWWVLSIVHGWWLASRRLQRDTPPWDTTPVSTGSKRRQRLIGLVAALVVLLALGYLRLDAYHIHQEAEAAHRNGDCTRALSALHGLWAGHRVADSPLTARAEDESAACELLLTAERQATTDPLLAARTLDTYHAHPGALWQGVDGRKADLFLAQATGDLKTALSGDTKALEAGFGHLAQALSEAAGQEAKAGKVLDDFLNALPTEDACETKTITDWLAERPSGGGVLDRAAEVVPKVAPAAIVGCGDALAKDKEWKQAKAQYEQLLDQYPDDDLVSRAKKGKEKAGLEIELANVRKLLKGSEPKYCKDPAPYHGAKPYRGNGPHRAIFIGQSGHRKKLPSSWLTKDPAKAVLVICAGETKYGSSVRTCPYRPLSGSFPYNVNVTFKKRKIPVRVYELRTGKRVGPRSVQIGGSACPRRIHYTYYISDLGPPRKMYVKSSKSDIRTAYSRIIRP